MKVIFTRVALVLAFSASSLLAGTVSYSHTTPTQTAPFTDNFTLSDFDPTLGNTLTGITISLSYNTTGEVDIFDNSSLAVVFTNATTSTPLAVNAPGSLTITTNAVAGPVSGTADPKVVTTFPGLTGSGMPSLVVPMADWSLFEGTGFATFSLTASGPNASILPPPLLVGGNTTVGGITTITYSFASTSEIPEPATMGLIGSALLGIGFFALKRTKKA